MTFGGYNDRLRHLGKYAPTTPVKVGVNRQFQAQMPKYRNRTISETETINTIKPNLENEAATTSYTLWVGYHYTKLNPTWPTAAILKTGHSNISDVD